MSGRERRERGCRLEGGLGGRAPTQKGQGRCTSRLMKPHGAASLPARRRLLLLGIFAALLVLARRHLRDLRTLRHNLLTHARRWLSARYASVRAITQQTVESKVEAALDRAAEHVRRNVLKDAAMPAFLQRGIDQFVDSLLPDIKQELFAKLDERFLPIQRLLATPSPVLLSLSPLSPRRSHAHHDPSGRRDWQSLGTLQKWQEAAQAAARVDSRPRLWLWWHRSALNYGLRKFRAAALHTLWPHNRSLWRSMRTPHWWLLQVLGVLPVLGQIWWLLVAVSVDKQDEFQLCQFIVALRTSHFVTLGVGAALFGCLQALRCQLWSATPPPAPLGVCAAADVGDVDAGTCHRLAPHLTTFSAGFWLLQLVVTTRAFLLLPHSQKKGQRVVVERRSRLSLEARRAIAAGQPPPPHECEELAPVQPGGVLLRLGSLDDGLAALAALASAGALLLYGPGSPASRISLYWIRTAHALLSAPYLLFKLPLAVQVLTHARRTGYDRMGHCVPAQPSLPTPPPTPTPAREAGPAPPRAGSSTERANDRVARRLSFDLSGSTARGAGIGSGPAEELEATDSSTPIVRALSFPDEPR